MPNAKLCVAKLTIGLLLATAVVTDAAETVRGRLWVTWGAAEVGSELVAPMVTELHTPDGTVIPVDLTQGQRQVLGGTDRMSGAEVTLDLAPGEPPRQVRSLVVHARESRATEDISGSYPWISILCKFAGNSSEPRDVAFFQSQYGTSWPGLNHYWRTLSYGMANVDGSTAVAWVQMPHPASHYADQGSDGNWQSSDIDLNELFEDCTDAADHLVYFPDFVGINMMFNDTFGPWAWGGSRGGSMDGGGWWRVTWEPPWGWKKHAVLAHEMGHGFGLPHSNNADGDNDPYDNPWDVMSDAHYWGGYSSTYGTVGKGTIAYHLDRLGWIPASEKVTVDPGTMVTATVDHLALPSTTNLRMIRVPISGSSRYYTVEVRDQEGYDENLPGFAVVIHEVFTGRSEPAWLVDAAVPTNGADAGAMWVVGECFEDEGNEISICVESVATEGFLVRVLNAAQVIHADGFESGSLNEWSGP
jgi:hypothetical protein